jgi:hypothetical protein
MAFTSTGDELMKPDHECPFAEDKGFEVRLRPYEVDVDLIVWYLYDKQSHSYTFGIRYCPFCGDKL